MENSDVCIRKAIYKVSTFNNKIATYISFGDNYVTKVDPSFCYEERRRQHCSNMEPNYALRT